MANKYTKHTRRTQAKVTAMLRGAGCGWLVRCVILFAACEAYYQQEILGVRYARIPRRFAAAEAEPFPSDISTLTTRGPRCWQSGCDGQSGGYGNNHLPCAEDCLFLNVFRPHEAGGGSLLPVMVYIHGGGMTAGSGMNYNGSLIASSQGVIVVAINYRQQHTQAFCP